MPAPTQIFTCGTSSRQSETWVPLFKGVNHPPVAEGRRHNGLPFKARRISKAEINWSRKVRAVRIRRYGGTSDLLRVITHIYTYTCSSRGSRRKRSHIGCVRSHEARLKALSSLSENATTHACQGLTHRRQHNAAATMNVSIK